MTGASVDKAVTALPWCPRSSSGLFPDPYVADWGEVLMSRKGFCPKDWPRIPLCDKGEAAGVSNWAEWHAMREVPLSSPIAIAMSPCLTLFHMIR